MGDQSAQGHLDNEEASAARAFSLASLRKSAVVIAPLAGANLFIATGTSAPTIGCTAAPSTPLEIAV
jgi:hypothetical protein